MSKKQKIFADEYAATGNAKAAAMKAYPETNFPSQMAYELKKKEEVREYIALTAQKCAEIQMEIIVDKDMPAAVRNDAIKFRLGVAGIKDETEPDDAGSSIQTVIIKIDK